MSDPQIEVTRNGSYHVTGGIPLVRVTKVTNEKGEHVDWETYEELETEDEYWLCRCGGSSNKPFCDGTHSKNKFDGTESAQTDDYRERAEVLGGTKVTIRDDRGICAHAAFCSNKVTNVWDAAKEIDDDPELRDQIVSMVQRCPSGALTYEVDGEPTEPDFEPQIRIQKDASILLRGGITVKRHDGEPLEMRNRMALCRCGKSKNKPLCDGSHFDAEFRDG
jgi:CDGSH-type Zn-finger protein